MNSIFNNIMNLFFEKAEHPVKPLMYAQFTGVVIAGFFMWNTNRFYWLYLMLGTSFLLTGIEKFIVKETKHKGYLLWFICALLFYLIAVDDYFFI